MPTAIARSGAAAIWVACDPRALDGPLPRQARAASALYTNGARLLRFEQDGRGLVARRLAGPEAAQSLFALVNHLAARCEHVPPPRLLEDEEGRATWLAAEYLEGRPWIEEGGPQQRFAEALLALHAAMRSLPAEPIAAAGRERQARALAWLQRHGHSPEVLALAGLNGLALPALHELLQRYLAGPSQPVHNDLHAANVWWSRGRVWFLDLEETASSYLPVLADVLRYVERQVLRADARVDAGMQGLEDFWRRYYVGAGEPFPAPYDAFAALAWNWLDSWATLETLAPRPADYESERRKFLRILQCHGAHWPRLADRLARM